MHLFYFLFLKKWDKKGCKKGVFIFPYITIQKISHFQRFPLKG